MNHLGAIIQFFLFVVLILVMTKALGYSDNGLAVIASVVLGGIAYWAIYILSSKYRESRPPKNIGNTLKRGNSRARKKMDK